MIVMKTKIFLCFFLFTSYCLITTAQVPQGFNYQAIVRNASGNLLQSKALKITVAIKTSLTGGTILWEEYQNVTSNYLGLVSFAIGSGTRVSGTITSFDKIDWKAQPLYLKTTVEYPVGTVTDMGTAQMLSVPYSLVAKDVQGPIGKLDIKGTEASPDSALFEVKNKNGQTIFAVYNEGVRIYVDDGAKGVKGGFAVGGFGTGKALSKNYFVVNADSIRAYIGPTTGKSSKGGFAVGSFDASKGSPEEYLRVTRDSTRIYINQGTKKPKGGFAVGGFDQSKGPVVPFLDLSPTNYFIGHESGLNITTGLYNSLIGYQSGKANTEGNSNIFIGYQSGFSNKVGSDNTFVGYQAGYSNIGNNIPGVFQHGKWNSYFGYMAGYSSVMGDFNTMIGYQSGKNNLASLNTFVGYNSGLSNTEGAYNTFMGVSTGANNTLGSHNVFLGHLTGYGNIEGENNIYIGGASGAFIRSGKNNVIIGDGAGSGSVYGGDGTGSFNVIIGSEAGKYSKNGTSNVFIGNQAGSTETGSNKLIIDNSSSATPLVYGNFETDVFRVNGNVEATIFNTVSDSALKQNITLLRDVIGKLSLLRGVYFDWNLSENSGLLLREGRQIGLIAQDVEKVYPEIVMINDRGYKMVDYTKLTPVLLEAIKEQQQQIESTRQENQQLKTQLITLQEKVEQIEIQFAKAGLK